MKHLNKFYNYLNESTSLDKEELEDNFISLKDTIDVEIEEYEADFRGNLINMYRIRLVYFKIKKEEIKFKNLNREDAFFKEDFWEILNELVTIKSRLGKKYEIGVDFTGAVIILYIMRK